MIELPCVYIIVKDMNKAVEFYKELLETEIDYQNEDRWVNFRLNNGLNLALYNKDYDLKKLENSNDLEDCYSENYISEIRRSTTNNGNNNIILNFQVDDLNSEYERIKRIKHAKISEIMYVNLVTPYYFFNVEDLDGNTLEVTGKYK